MGIIKFVPSNEMGTREWFAANLNKFDYSIIKSQSGYPDYVLEDGNEQQVKAEIEYLSASFIWHKHDASKCDLVLCWRHNSILPLPVLELSSSKVYQAHEEPQLEPAIAVLKEKGINIGKLYQTAITKCANEYRAYELAFVADMDADKQALDIQLEPRRKLLAANRVLTDALKRNGFVNLKEMHPQELMMMFGESELKKFQKLLQ